jgi:hypothetical protein
MATSIKNRVMPPINTIPISNAMLLRSLRPASCRPFIDVNVLGAFVV